MNQSQKETLNQQPTALRLSQATNRTHRVYLCRATRLLESRQPDKSKTVVVWQAV